jgi:hypothetical protein
MFSDNPISVSEGILNTPTNVTPFQSLGKEGGEVSHQQKAPRSSGSERKTPIWVTATGTWKTRVKKAKYYLGVAARVPSDAADRSDALFIVVCNLRRYFRLKAPFAAVLFAEHYAPRLVKSSPDIQPWTTQEVLEKYRLAGKRGMYPTLGVSDPRAKRKAARMDLRKEVRAFIRRCVIAGGSCTPKELLAAFITFRGGEAVNDNAFGRAVVAVTGIKSITPFGKRTYRGFHIRETAMGLTKDFDESEKVS